MSALRVHALRVKNFKGISEIEVRPGTNLIVISGRNGAGKSSTLDAIWWVLCSKAAGKAITNPIRDGEKEAEVSLDLGEITVTKTQKRGKAATLVIKDATGAKKKKPATLLASMVDAVSMDPMEFTRASPMDRLKMLQDVVELPFNPKELDERRADAYAERTDANRDVARLKARADSMPVGSPGLSVVSVGELLEDHAEAVRRQEKALGLRLQVTVAEGTVAELEQAAKDAVVSLEEGRDILLKARAGLSVIPGNLIDPDTIKASIDNAEENNKKANAASDLAAVMREWDKAREEAGKLSMVIEAIDNERSDGMAAASFPVPGLGFTSEGVLYKGVPFEDCCTGEQWRVAIAIVMARDPRVHVLRVKDGSLLDDEAMETLDEMCVEHDWDGWVEIVGAHDLEYPGVEITEGDA